MADDFSKRFIDGLVDDLKVIKTDVQNIKAFQNKAIGAIILFHALVTPIIAGAVSLIIWWITKN